MSHISWDTVDCSTETSDESEAHVAMSKEAFDDCLNCLNSLNDCLWHLRRVVFYSRLEDMTTGTFLSEKAHTDSEETECEQAVRLFRLQLQVFHRLEASLLAELSTDEYHRISTNQSKSRHVPRTEIITPHAGSHRNSLNDGPKFEQPRDVPKPDARSTLQRRSSPSMSSKPFEKTTAVRAESTPPVPARNPTRRVSDIHTRTGNVKLFNPPNNLPVNLLPEEHRARAKRRQPAQRENGSDPNVTTHGDTRNTPECTELSTSSSSSTSFSKILLPTRSISSLRLSAVAEDHPPLPQRDTCSPRQTPRSSQRNPRAERQQHVPATSGSQASNAFYTDERRRAPHPPSHLVAAARAGTGQMIEGGPGPAMSRQPSRRSMAGPPVEAAHQLTSVREKLGRERARAQHQMEEADRMLRGLAQVEALQGGWVIPERGAVGDGLGNEDDSSIGKRLKSLLRVGTKRAKVQVMRV